jgi:hydrogenase maturation protease
VIEPEIEGVEAPPDAHGMDPVQVLALARALGGTPPRTLVLGCEPQSADTAGVLSEPVRAALDEAERMVATLLEELTDEGGSR